MAEVLKRGDWKKGRRRGAAAAFARARPRNFMERFPPLSRRWPESGLQQPGTTNIARLAIKWTNPFLPTGAGENGSVDDQALAQAPRQADRPDFAKTADVFRRLGNHDEPFVMFEC